MQRRSKCRLFSFDFRWFYLLDLYFLLKRHIPHVEYVVVPVHHGVDCLTKLLLGNIRLLDYLKLHEVIGRLVDLFELGDLEELI